MNEYFTFTVSNQKFCIPLLRIKEIVSYREPYSVPGSAGFVEGMIMIRDDLITVIDPKAMFNIFDDRPPTHILIIDYDSGLLGISVDSIKTIIQVSDEDIVAMSSLFDKGIDYLSHVVKKEETLYNMLNLESFGAVLDEKQRS